MPRKGLRSYKEPDSDEESDEDLKDSKITGRNDEQNEDVESDVMVDEAEDKSEDDQNLASDDEAPVSMTFSKSKESALQKVKDAMQQIQDSKKQRKDKRRQMNEKYTDQKKRRLEALSKARLPDDILAEIPSQPVITAPPVEDNNNRERNESEDELHSNLSGEDEIEINQGFISLKYDRYGGVNVTTEREVLTKTKSLSESALEFRNKSLYGGRIPRISNKEKMLKNTKRKARLM